MSDPNLKRRTIVSFSILGLGGAALGGLWSMIRSFGKEGEDTATIFRKAYEFNGNLWSPPSDRTNISAEPPPGKIPRVNGDIGVNYSLDSDQWYLEVQNDTADPLRISLKDIMALPSTRYSTEFRCVEGWSENMSFAGVRFTDFLNAYKIQPKKYVGLVSVDGNYYVSIDIESMKHSQTLLAYEMNGRPLLPQNGAPLRLVIPIKYGIKNLKQIGRIFFSDTRPPDYWAERGYDWYASL